MHLRGALDGLTQTRNQIKHRRDLVVAVGEARSIAGYNYGSYIRYTGICGGLQFLDERLLASR
jgi:hypothetical protein